MSDWLRRFIRDHPVLPDLIVVATALVAAGASVYYVAEQMGWGWALPLAIAPALALFRRRQEPFAVLGVGVAAELVQWVFGLPVNGAQVALLLSLYTIARCEPARSGRVALGVCLALVMIAPLRQPYQGPVNTVLQFLCVLVVWVLGTNVALRQGYLRALEERASRLELERDTAVLTATLTERARIAREMHDVVAHHVSVMVVQAEGASWAIDTAPDQARAAVVTIADTGRSTLAELRRLLGVLRGNEGKSAAPQPGLDDIRALVERFQLSGLNVGLEAGPDPELVPESVQLATYRVVQEGLTNVLKHVGAGTPAQVAVRLADGEIQVEIRNEGRGSPPIVSVDERAGHGLIGIRERAALFGGRTDIGHDPHGGFVVRAWFPVGVA
ncbi:histidine kinase [Kineosporia sp. NBRC 101731]|uniref:sensor histidine kinase n=1 Tax=Kineosporia sp. NBRC 101731 TaxID=3032199 RepID=UPI0024A15B59|nr:histidine kinase [Kineosporia sp. NBRC 101731]GLY31565.1 two-component sensor histidine kinase [Kineosporia sp. NBRC 101731]